MRSVGTLNGDTNTVMLVGFRRSSDPPCSSPLITGQSKHSRGSVALKIAGVAAREENNPVRSIAHLPKPQVSLPWSSYESANGSKEKKRKIGEGAGRGTNRRVVKMGRWNRPSSSSVLQAIAVCPCKGHACPVLCCHAVVLLLQPLHVEEIFRAPKPISVKSQHQRMAVLVDNFAQLNRGQRPLSGADSNAVLRTDETPVQQRRTCWASRTKQLCYTDSTTD